ncbi:MAG: polysaccharide deacetylase family protein [Chloroflexi bacterium]|nr:polysaccharide deacetylase family protein [Chloroflexota bacterium]
MRRRFTIGTGLASIAAIVTALAVGALTIGPEPSSTNPAGASPPASLVEPTPPAEGGGGAAIPWPSTGPGAASWVVTFQWHVPVLMYHLISTPAQAGHALAGLVISPTLFRDQLRAAWQAGWRTITAAQLARDMAAGSEPPPRTFVITIDDGSADGWTEAFPILRAFRFVATYFVPTARIGRPGDLSVADVVALSQAGMEIANHTVDHVPLAHMAPGEAHYQVLGAQAAIAALIGAAPITMAYPFGNRDLQVIEDVGAAGIGLAFSTAAGCSETVGARLDEPRLRVSPATAPAALVGELARCAGLRAWG